MSEKMIGLITQATGETLLMVLLSVLIAIAIGLPLGVWLLITRPGNLRANTLIHKVLAFIVNIGRSLPFIILMIALIPFTRWVLGTSIGTMAAVVPLAISAIPFYARLAEMALGEVSKGLIEAAQAMGANTFQIIVKVLIPESMAGLLRAATVTMITLVGYSAMAGTIGGGGLGDVAIRYGHQRFDVKTMLITIVLLLIIVQLMQWLGDRVARQFTR